MSEKLQLLGEKVVRDIGGIKTIEKYYQGIHPDLSTQFQPAQIVTPDQGWSGDYETCITVTDFPSVGTIYVAPEENGNGNKDNGQDIT